MSNLDKIKQSIDSQEGRADSLLQRLLDSKHTARALFALIVVVVIIAGYVLLWK